MSIGPPGHIPGYHAAGTLMPIGAIYQLQQQEQARRLALEQDADDRARTARRRSRHLLQLRPR